MRYWRPLSPAPKPALPSSAPRAVRSSSSTSKQHQPPNRSNHTHDHRPLRRYAGIRPDVLTNAVRDVLDDLDAAQAFAAECAEAVRVARIAEEEALASHDHKASL